MRCKIFVVSLGNSFRDCWYQGGLLPMIQRWEMLKFSYRLVRITMNFFPFTFLVPELVKKTCLRGRPRQAQPGLGAGWHGDGREEEAHTCTWDSSTGCH